MKHRTLTSQFPAALGALALLLASSCTHGDGVSGTKEESPTKEGAMKKDVPTERAAPVKTAAPAKSAEPAKEAAPAVKGEAPVQGEAQKLPGDPVSGAGTKTASGLEYWDIRAGNGEAPPAGAAVKVHYTGWLTNGTKFDSSLDRGQPFRFSLRGGVIQGWLEGVATMKPGGKRKLLIPPALGYGARGFPPVIPPESTLVFDVELLEIVP
jgi:peptidylprolyl isomerase